MSYESWGEKPEEEIGCECFESWFRILPRTRIAHRHETSDFLRPRRALNVHGRTTTTGEDMWHDTCSRTSRLPSVLVTDVDETI